jgi:transposase
MTEQSANKDESPRSFARFQKRKAAVDAVRNGESPSVVARIFGVPIRSVFKWISRYRAGGYDGLKEKQRSGRPRKVSGEVMQWIYDAVTLGDPRQHQFEFCLWTLGTIRQLLKREFKIELSKSGVSRLLAHLGLSPQRPIYRSYKRDVSELRRYLDETFPGLRAQARRTGAVIYFVDEAAVRSDAHRGTTWGKIGQTPEVEDSGDRFSLKLISAVSPRGDMRFACFEGRMTAKKFIDFVKKLRHDANGPIIVIADNAPYHTAKIVKKYTAETKNDVTIGYLPRYSPELNPDEQVWNHAKARLAKLFLATKDEFRNATHRILQSIQSTVDLVLSFFQLPDTKYAAE